VFEAVREEKWEWCCVSVTLSYVAKDFLKSSDDETHGKAFQELQTHPCAREFFYRLILPTWTPEPVLEFP